MKNIFNLGIEIEGLLNNDMINFQIREYHHGVKIPKLEWKAERDSSIRLSTGIDFDVTPIELISGVIKCPSEFKKEIDKFIKYFSINYSLELNDVFVFNKSCGSHIHVSINRKPHYFYKKGLNKCFIQTRKKFYNKIRESNIPKNIQTKILRNYNRYHAQQSWITFNRSGVTCERNFEFNFISEFSGKGIEWRALNMNGIETWEQFREFWNIVYDCVKYLIKSTRKWSNSETFRINMKEKDIKVYLKPINQVVYFDNLRFGQFSDYRWGEHV